MKGLPSEISFFCSFFLFFFFKLKMRFLLLSPSLGPKSQNEQSLSLSFLVWFDRSKRGEEEREKRDPTWNTRRAGRLGARERTRTTNDRSGRKGNGTERQRALLPHVLRINLLSALFAPRQSAKKRLKKRERGIKIEIAYLFCGSRSLVVEVDVVEENKE